MADAKRDRAEFTKALGTTAWAVRVGDQYFAGFSRDATVVKLRRHLADARFCVSTQQAADYVRRLAERGHPHGSILTVRVVGSAS